MPRAVPRPATARAATPSIALGQPFAPRVLDVLVNLPDARWLDRLLRGRAWIALIAVALIGLVFMQVSMLKMNAGIGQAVEHSSTLERQNADLRANVSQLSSEERIQRVAAEMGLVMPPAGDIRYLRSRGTRSDAVKAAQIMRAPSPSAQQIAAAAAAASAVQAADPATTAPPTAAAQAAQVEQAAPAQSQVSTAPAQSEQQTAPAQPQQAATAQPQQAPPAQPQQTAPTQPQAQAAAPAPTGAAVAPGTGQ